MQGKIEYEFSARIWKHGSPGGWHFVFLPKVLYKEIRDGLKWQEQGWGRMKAFVKCGEMEWESAIWFDSKHDTYILPIKAEVRRQARLSVDQDITVKVCI